MDYAYFPLNALIAITNELPDGEFMDMAVVGSETCIGLLGLFKDKCPYRVYVAHSGLSYKIALSKLRQYVDVADCWIHKSYMQSSYFILEQIAAETTCAHFHSLQARLAKWILRRTELVNQTYLEVTHQHIAKSLGVSREGVTMALSKIPGVQLNRNRIDVIDRTGLKAMTCGCYHPSGEKVSGLKALCAH